MLKLNYKKILLATILIASFLPFLVLAADNKVQLQVPIPGLNNVTLTDVNTCDGKTCSGIALYISAIYNYGVRISGFLAIIIMMYGGFLWLSAGGNTGQIDNGKKYITGAITGLSLLFCSYAILYILNPDLVNLPNLSIGSITQKTLTLKPVALDKVVDDESGKGIFDITGSNSGSGSASVGEHAVDKDLNHLDNYVASNNNFGLPPGSCLGWVYQAYLKIYGAQITGAMIWGEGNYPSQVARAYYYKGKFKPGLSGQIQNGDIVFMYSHTVPHPELANILGNEYVISHIGIYYNGHIYHQMGSDGIRKSPIKSYKVLPSDGVLSDYPNEVVVGYGQTGL